MPVVNFNLQLQFPFVRPGMYLLCLWRRYLWEVLRKLALDWNWEKWIILSQILGWIPLNLNAFFRKLDHFSSWIRRKFGILCTFRAGIRLNLCKLSLKMYVFSSVKAILRLFYVKKGINVFKRSLKLFTAVHGRYINRTTVVKAENLKLQNQIS